MYISVTLNKADHADTNAQSPAGPLSGLRVLVCRPEQQANDIAEALHSLGATVKTLPTIEIVPIPLEGSLKSIIIDLDRYDKVIVISAHAADLLCQHIDQYWPQLPVHQQWFAIGRKTATQLARSDIEAQTSSGGIDSEALLNEIDLQDVKGQRILIARGVGGRDTLMQTLSDRGAHCEYADLYHRQCPDYADAMIKQHLDNFSPQLYICLSQETLYNLHILATSQHYELTQYKVGSDSAISLEASALLVPGERVASYGKELGFEHILIPENLTLEAQIQTIIQYQSKKAGMHTIC